MARKVFDIAEILETILFGIDNKTLLLVQRVDNTFAATVRHSPRLQRKLFMDQPTKKSAKSISHDSASINHLVSDHDITISAGGCSVRIWPARESFRTFKDQGRTCWYFYLFLDPLRRTPKPMGCESWRKMLLGTAVGYTTIHYECYRCTYFEDQALTPLDSEQAVTLGQIVRHLRTHHAQHRCHYCKKEVIDKGMILTGRLITGR